MGKNTIKFYRKLTTEKLKNLLKSFETAQNNIEHLLIECKKTGDSTTKLEKKMYDNEIDINLIRMELNKRLWKESI